MTGRPLVYFSAFAFLLSLSVDFGGFPRPVNAAEVDYTEKVAPILEKYCTGCHNEDESKGELNLSRSRRLNKAVRADRQWFLARPPQACCCSW